MNSLSHKFGNLFMLSGGPVHKIYPNQSEKAINKPQIIYVPFILSLAGFNLLTFSNIFINLFTQFAHLITKTVIHSIFARNFGF